MTAELSRDCRTVVDVWITRGGASYHVDPDCCRIRTTIHPPLAMSVPLFWFEPPGVGGILHVDERSVEHADMVERLRGYTLDRGGCYVCRDA